MKRASSVFLNPMGMFSLTHTCILASFIKCAQNAGKEWTRLRLDTEIQNADISSFTREFYVNI